ncbi:MAG TPA: acyl-CoA dehydrogenase [Dehalococcoidia bacterium]|nr:acyl-CoA dehydrogenase [Dehalococcoidia bacterium]
MDVLLSEEERMFKKLMRDFAEKELEPYATEVDRRDEFNWDGFRKMGAMGLMGLHIPEKYGGQGGSYMNLYIAMEEISRVCASTALTLSNGCCLALRIIYDYGTEEQRQRYVVPAARGEKLCCYALTEREAGSDASSLRTTATHIGNDWVLNGSKLFITNGNVADTIIVWATVDKSLGSRGITAFLVEKGTPGLSVGKIENKLGMRGSPTVELLFDDCRIPGENVLGEVRKGLRSALSGLDGGRISIAGQAIGIAQAALDTSIAYAKERKQFGQTLAEFQAIQFMIVDMKNAIDSARLVTYGAVRTADAGKHFTREAAQAKILASEAVMDVTRKAMQIYGGYSYTKDLPLERYYREAKITEIYEGTNEICRIVVARSLLT